MDKLSAVIIGCGDIGFLFDYNKKITGALTHFRAFRDSGYFEVTGIADKEKKIRDIINHDFGVKVFSDYEKMCAELRPDVIVVATNDESHYGILANVIKYKPRLVFCEKPLSLNLDDVEKISKHYSVEKILLQVNFTRRFLEQFEDIKKIIDEKKIGEIESITFYYSRGLIHNASHYLDLINWYIGETEKNLFKVSVKKGLSKRDDSYSFDMIYKNGPEVRFIAMNPTKLSFAEVDFIGTKGRVKINYRNEIEKYKVVENKIFRGYSAYELYETKPIQFAKALPNAVENIYKAISKKEKLRSPASNSIKVFELINRIKEKKICQN